MTSPRPRRRAGSAGSRTRAVILRSTERIMLEQGYAAITYRSVATEAGVTPGLVQYYFPAIGELFVAVLRAGTDRIVERMARLPEAEQPLRAIWDYAGDRTGTALLMEFMALANHRKELGPVIGEGGERVRRAQSEALTRAWSRYGLSQDDLPPAALLFLMSCIPRMMHLEESFGTFTGHAETVALVERFLDQVEPRTERQALPGGDLKS
ncbi:TetR/AcrR family transcriptional regulator [Actinocorallia populi]|uniref:TetR/AcrR family transcriptional regulator n=1 Tax=Actinocorallia populi TaxID=2079200 RepID=UPI000D093320|nr:TetR/AcrR family transcriptional regulator [Actinocorallia populi]